MNHRECTAAPEQSAGKFSSWGVHYHAELASLGADFFGAQRSKFSMIIRRVLII
jgi:hypothetical protein